MKKILSLLLTMSMVLGSVATTAFAAEFSDTDGHWAESAIERWSDYGVVNGTGNGAFHPDANMTRAEMAQLYVNLLNLTETADISNFTDIPAGAWYADAIAKCVAAGILNGTSATTVSPMAPVTREQMFVTFGRAMGVTPSADTDSTLSDLDNVSDWARGMVNALLDAGYVAGTGNNTLMPLADINRASVVSLLNQTVSTYANEPGATVRASGESGITLVVTGDVTITGQVGDLVVAQGTAQGSVTLENATVSGTVTVTGAADLTVTGESSVNNLVVDAAAQGAQITVDEDAAVSSITTAAEQTSMAVAGTVQNVTVSETAADTYVTVARNAEVGSIATAGTGTHVSVSGTVENVTISNTASDATVRAESGANVENVTTAGADTTVSGSGTVSKVEAAEGSSGTSVTTNGTTVENNGSGSVTTGNGSIAEGDTDTTTRPSTGGGSSGGSSGGGSSHSHNYVDGICAADGAYDPAWAQVNSVETWNAAMDGTQNIILTDSFTADAQLTVNRAVTINGNGHTVTAGTWADPNPTSGGDAALVSVTAGDNAVVIKNITITGAKNIEADTSITDAKKDNGHGINVYESSNVTLNNVTLTNNAGAGMVVNSSTVTATGLHTSENGWGGVNIDANVENVSASLNFDATSTFGESVAVYSDKGGVTVDAPEGWVEVTSNGKTAWAKLFDGGDGTAESPYLISTPQEFYNVGLLTDANNHFKLIADINMDNVTPSTADRYGDKGDLYWLYGELDGNGRTITSTKDTAGTILYAQNATIKNVTFNVKDHPAVTNANATTFENVTVTGTMEVSNNCGAFVTYATPVDREVTLTFNNCTANVKMTGGGGQNNYNAVFVGYAYGEGNKTTLIFNSCVNEGSLVCGKAAMFLGNNSASKGKVSIVIDNCVNKGEIRSTYTATNYGWNAFVAVCSHANNTITLNGTQLTLTNGSYTLNGAVVHVPVSDGGGFYQGPADTALKLTEDKDNKTFTITEAADENVSYYVVTMSLYASLLDDKGELEGGTMVVRVSERIEDTNAGTYTTTMKHLPFVDEEWVNAHSTLVPTTEGSGDYQRTLYTLDGQSYYYFGSKEDTMASLNGTPKEPQSISVSAYDASGNLLCSTALSK